MSDVSISDDDDDDDGDARFLVWEDGMVLRRAASRLAIRRRRISQDQISLPYGCPFFFLFFSPVGSDSDGCLLRPVQSSPPTYAPP